MNWTVIFTEKHELFQTSLLIICMCIIFVAKEFIPKSKILIRTHIRSYLIKIYT